MDVYSRFKSGSTAGRGSVAGWTPCPLCCNSSDPQSPSTDVMMSSYDSHNKLQIPSDKTILGILADMKSSKSLKLFSHGRGLSAHLHAVHTPWQPGKAELKRRTAMRRRVENEQKRLHTKNQSGNTELDEKEEERPKKRKKLDDSEKWEPSIQEIDYWNKRVLEIVNLVEVHSKTKLENSSNDSLGAQLITSSLTGIDRSGNCCPSYRESLPEFLAASADGDITKLKRCVNKNSAGSNDTCITKHIKSLLSCRDRNGSTAEHWAAGGGHVDCLSYIYELSDMVNKTTSGELEDSHVQSSTLPHSLDNKKIRRRRDGKTSLHYAARNGHIKCIDLIMSRKNIPPTSINTPSGDGTTPLHMACYGGHPSTVRHLVKVYDADVHAVNDWACGAAHWAAMSIGHEGMDAVIELCNYLKEDCGVDFVKKQKQGHAPLHKAAAKKNQAVIEWLASKTMSSKEHASRFSQDEINIMGESDDCGNSPSDIWSSVGGDACFAQWMKDLGW